MPLFDFHCDSCKAVFDDFSSANDAGEVASVHCPGCGSMARQVWINAPSNRFSSMHELPRELRDAARIQLGQDFKSRQEHDDYCRENGYEPITRKEFESVAVSAPNTEVPGIIDGKTLDERIHEKLDQNYHKLINGELPPQEAIPESVRKEIVETAANINKTIGATA